MEPHQERVAIEAEELRAKHAALTVFLLTSTFGALGEDEQDLLRRQHFIMTDYLHCLADRMALWGRYA